MNLTIRHTTLRLASLAALAVALAGCVSTSTSMQGIGTFGQGGDAGNFDAAGSRAPTIDSMHSMAKLCVSQGRDKEAEGVLHRVLEQQPDFLPAYEELAEIYLRAEMLDSAIAILNLGLTVSEKDAVLYNDLGMCQLLQKDYLAALDSFTAAAGLSPTDARCRANMAVTLGLLGRVDEALSLYLQVLPPADAHWNVAVLCDARKDFERATQEYARAGQPVPLTQ